MLLIIMLNKASLYTLKNRNYLLFPSFVKLHMAKWQVPARESLIYFAKICITKDKSLSVSWDPFIWFLTNSIIPLFIPLLDLSCFWL